MSKKENIGYHFNGLKELKKELLERASSSDVEDVVKRNATQVQQKSMDNASSVYKKGYSKDDTKKSIGVDFGNNGWAGRVTMGMNYNQYTEKGTRFMAAEPLLEPAFRKQKTLFKSELENLLK